MKSSSRKGRRSSLEYHKDREAILALLARKVSVKNICAQFPGLSKDVLYRWIASQRPANDREARKALRKLRGETMHLREGLISSNDRLAVGLHELDIQKARLISAQNAALRLGDLQRVSFIADTIARNVRHAAALSEVQRLRLQNPATNFATSKEYRDLREDVLRKLPPSAVASAAEVFDRFEAEPYQPDEQEKLY
jgi:hypothetical protein